VGRPHHGTTSLGSGIIHSVHGSGNWATHWVAPYEWWIGRDDVQQVAMREHARPFSSLVHGGITNWNWK
jgi:hypothetical protein